MTKWYILLIFVQLHVLLGNGKAEDINLIQSIRTEVSTSMSSTSTWHSSVTSWDSNNSIDNKATGDPNTCGFCAGTSNSKPPWLQIDLGSVYTIKKIQITGRADRSNWEQFQNIYIFVSNTSMETSNGTLVYNGNPNSDTMFKLPQRPPVSFRYLIIRRFHASFLTICEIELFEAGVNLLDDIRDKVLTNQSSIYLSNNTSFGPYNAIDGKSNYDIDTCMCCSVTDGTSSSWWQIDLRNPYLVDRLEIFGRADTGKNNVQLQGAKIFAGNVSSDNAVNPWKCIYVVPTITTTTHFDYQLDEPVTAQIFNITLNSTVLTLCEFIVYGRVPKCDVGLFGNTCSQKCHCADKNSCNVWTGKCKAPGCLPGWTGQACNKECAFRRFGINCSTECHCAYNSTCNKINGMCTTGLCEPGWYGESCSQVCDSGKYGNQCSSSCGHCEDGTTCNNVNGTCFDGCIDGYFYNATDTLCKTPCDEIHFGKGCNKTCHCKSGNPCINGNGECPKGGCATGWTSRACDTMCTNGSYGYECKNVCGKCVHGCNNVNGTCSGGCFDGYILTDVLCKTTCQSGFYGHNCTKPCGHCNKDFACNISSGFCFDGCSAGFNGHLCETSCRNSTFGPNCASPCHCSGNSQCDIFQGNCSNDCDIGWAGFNCSIDLNILRRNTTSATALQSRMYSTCSADRAIDGIDAPVNPSNDADLCAVCSVAQNENSAQFSWWQLDLGSMFLVKFIRIFGRPNLFGQSQNIIGYINNISMEVNQTGTMLQINSSMGYVFLQDLIEPRLFQYLKIQKQDTVLTICEVKLYEAECPVGTFGDRCSNPCQCADKLNCDKVNGTCVSEGCLPGWEGTSCNKSCGHQHFGPDCKYQCHCFSNGSCAKNSGNCNNSRCDPGWELFNCSKACSFPQFGDNCRDTCHCLNNSECDHRDGKCDIKLCEAGWQGQSCNNVCDYRKFGINCSSACNCRDNTSCDAITGHCKNGLCDPGWLGLSCDIVCDHRRFGINCSSECNCRDNTSCNAETGHCNTGLCDPGWLGHRCDKVCKHRYFGLNCSSSCYCLRNSSCDPITGKCLSGTCDPGWQDLSCDQACNFPHFGDNCNDICHCIDNSRCNHINGSCDRSLCDAGWHGDSCNDACNGTFGYNCSNKCHCDRDDNCRPTDGKCLLGGCQKGWQGDNCSIEVLPLSQDQPSSTTAAVAGGVSATVIVIALGVIIGFIIYKKRNASAERNSKRNAYKDKTTNLKETRKSNLYGNDNKSFDGIAETNINESVSNDYYSFGECSGIKICELWDYIYKKMENNCEQFYKEFKTLPYGLVHSHKSADEIANKGKNRYREMYAYDHTRVILSDVEDGKNTDYINACYIDGYEKVKKFVASQGATKQMIDDFWRMVWQLKSDKIVMLTNLIEMGTNKCMQYWPNEDEGNECTYDKVIVKLLNTETFLDYNIRHLEVRMNDEPRRRIRQFHFKSWPDKDVPDSTWCLVNFWRVVDTNAISKAGPIVVHCSAGVGRTGTFIGLDNMVNQARVEGFVRPLQVVQTLRQQRVNMVQTKEQYVYLHEAVADALLFGTHIVWTKQFGDVLSFMTQNEKNNTRTRLQIQFELIEESVVNSSSEVSESPEYSNVETLLSESDAYRPKLKNRGSKFVQQLRAMYIPNYKGKSTFLVSMSPDKDTMEEFWSLVDDNNIKTVIMLTEQSSPCYQSSCELGSSSKGASIFSVNKKEEKIRKGYTQRTFTFKESGREEEDYLTTVKQFEYTAWKDGYPSPGDTTSFLDMIEAVLKWQPHFSESQPVLVFCGDGCTRSGIVCVLLNELQRIKYEGGHVNIVESVKMMKKRQRHLIGSYEQYKFCFDLMMDHIKRTDVYQNL